MEDHFNKFLNEMPTETSLFNFFFQYRSCKLTLDIHILDNDSFSFDGQVVHVINYGKFKFCLGVSLIGVDGVWASV